MSELAHPWPVRTLLASRVARVAVVVAIVAGAYVLIFGIPTVQAFLPYRIDLDVYRLGGRVFLEGGEIYGRLPDTQIGANLPFTYPPIAAMLFAPVALLPYQAANFLFAAATVACLFVVVRLVLRDVTSLRGDALRWAALAAFAVLLPLGPVWETSMYGQVNVFLMTLVVVDVVVGRGKWWQGSLIGLAMAVKLTPAVFLAYFLVRRDWRALAMGVGSALLYTGIGFVVTFDDAVTFWTSAIVDPSRVGTLAYVSNQSLNGVLVRLGLSDGGGLVWFALCAVIGLSLLAVMAWLFRGGHDVAAMLTMAAYSLLASPVSWSHHFVWVVPALILLVVWAHRSGSRTLWVTAAVGFFIFLTRIIWAMPYEPHLAELEWTWWQQLIGNAQAAWALAFLVVVAFFARNLAVRLDATTPRS